jgi:uncharacterized membrane protein
VSENELQQAGVRRHDPLRVLALSDGVMAIILTLLVLEIHVPELSEGQGLRQALRDVQPSFIAFLISFVVVAIAWAQHRDLFALIRRTNRLLVWLNLLYLLPLCLLPFGASLLARYDRDPTALRMYGLILVAMTLTRTAILVYATNRPNLLYAPVDSRSRRWGFILVVLPLSAYLAAIAVANSTPTVSLAIYALAPIIYFFGMLRSRSAPSLHAADA